MRDCASTYFDTWSSGCVGSFEATIKQRPLQPASQLCLKLLKSTGHRITVAPISRWVAAYWADPSDHTYGELCKVICALTSFSVMWRSAHGGINGIDGIYRSIMEKGECITGLPPLCRIKCPSELPSWMELCAALWAICANHDKTVKFDSTSAWSALVFNRPVYDDNEAIARFLLLLAAHHAVVGPNGLTKDGAKADHTNMMSPDRWDDPHLRTVEHIAPRNPKVESDWDGALYQRTDLKHQLGNLAILPGDDNSWLGNKDWELKRHIYLVLAAPDPDAAEKYLSIAESKGLSLSADRRKILIARRRHLPALTAVADYDGEWTVDHIEKRSKNILSRVSRIFDDWMPKP